MVRGDYRKLPFEDASFDAVFNLFSSLGYLERDEDVGVLREFRRVLRPGRALIMETAHRDGFARSLQPSASRRWDRLPDGSLYLEERTPDLLQRNDRHVPSDHQPRGRADRAPVPPYVYSVKEWTEMLREAGFADIEAFGGWDGATPATPAAWRLILRAR